MKKIAILGSTGSIGVQTLEVAKNIGAEVCALSAGKNIELLEKQIKEFKPKVVSVDSFELADILYSKVEKLGVEVYYGEEGLIKVATLADTDMVVSAVVGVRGLKPVLEAIKAKKDVALANKETLVAAGKIVMKEALENNVKIIPVDSEHSAIFQCMASGSKSEIRRIILTASGGPFRGKPRECIANVRVEDALCHPNWSMGNKITIDSATLMNKGLEIIEARWLFDMPISKIDVVVHPQSIVHSMVEYVDGSIIAQMGSPDMHLPIQYALTYPERVLSQSSKLSLFGLNLTFEKPDYETFPCLKMAYNAIRIGGTMPAVLNAANEEAVELFMSRKIRFLDIPLIIEYVMGEHEIIESPTLEDILKSDAWARNKTKEVFDFIRGENVC